MPKKVLVLGSMLLLLSLAVFPAFAETDVTPAATTVTNTATVTTRAADVVAKIVCVKTAVATREAALAVAVATHSQAVQAAYATRANELAGAYSNTTLKKLQAGVKVSWVDFNRSIKAATKAWKTNKNAIWATFRTAVKACKASSDVSDSANSGSEVSGG